MKKMDSLQSILMELSFRSNIKTDSTIKNKSLESLEVVLVVLRLMINYRKRGNMIMKKTLKNMDQTLKPATLGFTLIELLAVIVILAVIALIATPLIMGVINDAKNGSNKDSMFAYVKAVEFSAMSKVDGKTNGITGTFDIKNGDLYDQTTDDLVLKVAMKGTRPNGGAITLNNGEVTSSSTIMDGKDVDYDGKDVTVGGTTGKPIPTITPEPTERPYVDSWTDWLDSYYPEQAPVGGDRETFENIKLKYPNFRCDKALEIQARAQKFPDLTIESLEQVIHINLEIGLICDNSQQGPNFPFPICYNYEVKILCRNYE